MSGTRGDRRRRRASPARRGAPRPGGRRRAAPMGPDEERLGRGQREQAILGERLGTLREGAAGHDGEVVAHRRDRDDERPDRPHRRALIVIGGVGDADDDRVDLEVEAGLTDRQDVRSRAEMARSDVPARTGERLLEIHARPIGGRDDDRAARTHRPHLDARPAMPALRRRDGRRIGPRDAPGEVLEDRVDVHIVGRAARREESRTAFERTDERDGRPDRPAVERVERATLRDHRGMVAAASPGRAQASRPTSL